MLVTVRLKPPEVKGQRFHAHTVQAAILCPQQTRRSLATVARTPQLSLPQATGSCGRPGHTYSTAHTTLCVLLMYEKWQS